MTNIISHRGNLNGRNVFNENRPAHIIDFIEKYPYFDLELDVRIPYPEHGTVWLGHDEADYKFSEITDAIDACRNNIFFHAKDMNAASKLMKKYNYPGRVDVFFHGRDDMTITKNGLIWLYPNQAIFKMDLDWSKCVVVLPEYNSGWFSTYKGTLEIETYYVKMLQNCHSVCTDYPFYFDTVLNGAEYD